MISVSISDYSGYVSGVITNIQPISPGGIPANHNLPTGILKIHFVTISTSEVIGTCQQSCPLIEWISGYFGCGSGYWTEDMSL